MFSGFGVTNIFSSRKRAVHQRKRRVEAHMFAPQSIRAVEPILHTNVLELANQWDFLASHVQEVKNGGPVRGELGSTTWIVKDDRVWIDAMQCWLHKHIDLLSAMNDSLLHIQGWGSGRLTLLVREQSIVRTR